MSKYDELDKEIFSAIEGGASRFSAIRYTRAVNDAAEAHCTDGKRQAFRIIDARLQRMKRRGAIDYSSSDGWRSAPQSERGNG